MKIPFVPLPLQCSPRVSSSFRRDILLSYAKRLSKIFDTFEPLSTMAFPYHHILLIGATAGIGAAMADRLVAGGSKVTVVGRRKDRLDDFIRKHGETRAQAAPFDIADLEQIPQFVAE